MIQIQIEYKDYGPGPILKHTKLTLHPGTRYGLLGPNGCGKSTLLHIIKGSDQDYQGQVRTTPDTRIALVAQEGNFEPGLDTISWLCSEALRLRSELRKLEVTMADPLEVDNLDTHLRAYQDTLDAYEATGGDDAEERALRLLDSLGLMDRAFAPAGSLSGGEQGRLRLMAALDQRPQVLLLDEPGNHLDLWGLAWLESRLESFRGTLVLVSHDRRLLERLCTHTISLYDENPREFKGSYGAWRIDRIQNAATQGMAWQADRQHVARLEEVVRRFAEYAKNTADPAWGARLRAKRTQLQRAKDHASSKPNISGAGLDLGLSSQGTASKTALHIQNHDVERGGRVLIGGVELFISSGERVALVGRNGSGKTSLLDDIVNLGSWDHPRLRLGPSQKIAYVAQTRRGYDLNTTLTEHFLLLSPCRKEDIISFLRPYRFTSKDLDTPLHGLSGGQWNLFQLANAARMDANFLILDEPTNHLDPDAREALEDALGMFQGTLLVVSHDRWFLDSVCKRVVEIEDGHLLDQGLTPQEFLEILAQEAGQRDIFETTEAERNQRVQEKRAVNAIKDGRYAEAKHQGKQLAKVAKHQKT